MNWEDAIQEAKEEMGITGWTRDWDLVVERAREIQEEDYNNFCEDARDDYYFYLKSSIWKKRRNEILIRDNHKCKKCGNPATEVHHIDYRYVMSEKEKIDCISICHSCHMKIHGVKNV